MSPEWSISRRVTVAVIIIVLIGLFVYAIRPLINPLFVAILLAYGLNALARLLQKHTRLQRAWSARLVYFCFLALLIATPGTLLPIAVREIDTLSNALLHIEAQLVAFLANPVVVFNYTLYLEHLWVDFLELLSHSLAPGSVDAVRVLEITSTSFIWLILILVTTYYLLLDWHGLQEWLIRLAPEQETADMRRLLLEIELIWQAYLRGTLALMVIMGLFFIVLGLAIGLPGAVALGLFTGLLSMIPEVGPLVAGTVSVLVAFFQGSNFLPISNFWFALLVAAIYLVVMQIKSLWLRPIVMGRFMHMNSGLVFVAIIGAALLYGILGAIIVLPLLATAGLLGRYIRAKLLNLDPWPVVAETAAVPSESSPPPAEPVIAGQGETPG